MKVFKYNLSLRFHYDSDSVLEGLILRPDTAKIRNISYQILPALTRLNGQLRVYLRKLEL